MRILKINKTFKGTYDGERAPLVLLFVLNTKLKTLNIHRQYYILPGNVI